MKYRRLTLGETPRRGDHRQISVWSPKLSRWVRRWVWVPGGEKIVSFGLRNQLYRRRVYQYIKNGKPFETEDRIYFFEWVYGRGSGRFGMHGTETEYNFRHYKDTTGDNEIWRGHRLVAKRPVKEVAF